VSSVANASLNQYWTKIAVIFRDLFSFLRKLEFFAIFDVNLKVMLQNDKYMYQN
jgi:hypothetical protein